MVGGSWTSSPKSNPTTYLTDKQWAIICELAENLTVYKGIDESFSEHSKEWKKVKKRNFHYLQNMLFYNRCTYQTNPATKWKINGLVDGIKS
jgi:hypothetical protein